MGLLAILQALRAFLARRELPAMAVVLAKIRNAVQKGPQGLPEGALPENRTASLRLFEKQTAFLQSRALIPALRESQNRQ